MSDMGYGLYGTQAQKGHVPLKRYTLQKIFVDFYSKITGNQILIHFTLFLQAPVNIFRNQAQYGSIGDVLFLVI